MCRPAAAPNSGNRVDRVCGWESEANLERGCTEARLTVLVMAADGLFVAAEDMRMATVEVGCGC